jgi:hypothetical protein
MFDGIDWWNDHVVKNSHCSYIFNLTESPFEQCFTDLEAHFPFAYNCAYTVCDVIDDPVKAKAAACSALEEVADQCNVDLDVLGIDWRELTGCTTASSNPANTARYAT